MTLPSSFKYFISAWESTQPSERTLTNLISRFIIEESRTEIEERAENIAFTANKQYNKYNNNNNQYKKNFKEGNVRPVCHYCYKPGYHWIKECRKRKAATPNEKYTEKKGEALIGAMSAKYNLEAFSDSWHMDSGAAENMLNRRK